jgi:replicative DNA helicase
LETREREVSEIARGLKIMAKELRLPVTALSQINRSVETRNGYNKRPQLWDLRDSGAIEDEADNVYFIYRDFYYSKENASTRSIAELIVAKQRNGPTDTLHVRFDDRCTRFDGVPNEHPPMDH